MLGELLRGVARRERRRDSAAISSSKRLSKTPSVAIRMRSPSRTSRSARACSGGRATSSPLQRAVEVVLLLRRAVHHLGAAAGAATDGATAAAAAAAPRSARSTRKPESPTLSVRSRPSAVRQTTHAVLEPSVVRARPCCSARSGSAAGAPCASSAMPVWLASCREKSPGSTPCPLQPPTPSKTPHATGARSTRSPPVDAFDGWNQRDAAPTRRPRRATPPPWRAAATPPRGGRGRGCGRRRSHHRAAVARGRAAVGSRQRCRC